MRLKTTAAATEIQMVVNGNGDITCWNFAQNPEGGDAIVDDEPLDIFAPIT